jgi:carbon-monoxide dehydrogenase medium subunit
MGPFEYFEPETVEEAVALLSRHGDQSTILAAGTDLVPLMKQGTMRRGCIVSIDKVAGLEFIRVEGEMGARIGSLTTIRNVEKSEELGRGYGLLREASSKIASVSVRNAATLGGNLCKRAPGIGMAPALVVLSARIKLVSCAGERTVPLDRFFVGLDSNILKTDELLTEIQVPLSPRYTGGAYTKCSMRRGEDRALVVVAAFIALDEGKATCVDAKVAIGGVTPNPVRPCRAEELLKGKRMDEDVIVNAAQTASHELDPVDDVHGSADYKREMTKVCVRDSIGRATELAKSSV